MKVLMTPDGEDETVDRLIAEFDAWESEGKPKLGEKEDGVENSVKVLRPMRKRGLKSDRMEVGGGNG